MFQTNPRIQGEKHIKTYKNTRKHSTVASNKSSSMTVPSLRCKAQAAPVRPDTARGWKVRQQDAVREQKHYEILKKLSQNMAPNIRKFWKKEAELKPQPGVVQLLLFLGHDNKAASGTCGTADVCKCLGQSADVNLEQMSPYSLNRSENGCANGRSPAGKTNST